MTATILLVDDEDTFRRFLSNILVDHGYEVVEAPDLAEAYRILSQRPVEIVLLDQRLPDGNGLSLLERIQKEGAGISVIVITAHGEVESAVSAMKLGASDYVTKPVETEELLLILRRAEEVVTLRRELELLRRSARQKSDSWIIGETAAMKRVQELIERVAPTNASVLITGESGTGKEVVAHAIHEASPRAARPFVALNCAALPDNLLESELFGHEAGAFTDAARQKKGLVEVADGGTLFLDEISSMPAGMQAKLLRFLEDRTIRRVGGTKDIKVDTRLLAASNRDLQQMIEAGEFRQDLYYRLSVVPVRLPPCARASRISPHSRRRSWTTSTRRWANRCGTSTRARWMR
ncbi:MAG: sigma-54 dependent transcriptional regulator [Anaerolineae bacterium]|nr:sigma-54 dependent transcriptional regulator [Anaerolineae bacterium]